MRYGYFDDANREYVITTPKTPLPWINYLGNDGFFGLISNTCGGYSFYRDAKLRRITRFRYNNVPADAGGRCYYVRDGETVWSPTFLPARTDLDFYECRHGTGYSVFTGSKNGVRATLTCFVPLNSDCELHLLKLKNESGVPHTLQLYSALEWCLWNAVDDMTNFQRNLNIGEVEVVGSTIYHKTEYRERRNHMAFFTVNHAIDGFDTDRDTFLGAFNGWDTPQNVFAGVSGNSIAHGHAPLASHRIDMALQPGEETTLLFQLGYVENPEEEKFTAPGVANKARAEALMKCFATPEQAEAALCNLHQYWDALLSRFTVHTGDEKLDRIVNVWNQYQCMVTFNMSRSASYYESGTGRGMGFRDSCQDILGFVHLIPERARERILDIASIQFADGSTYHQYQPLTKRGNADVGSGFNDDSLWLVACTMAYINETGDFSILDESVPFDNVPGTEQPLLEHLRRSVFFTVRNIGPHGLPLIGRADWNDCLNLNCFSEEPGESFQTTANFESGIAESVFIAGMFVKYAVQYANLLERLGQNGGAKAVRIEVANMERAVIEHGWDGSWFLRAYDAFGNMVGSKTCEEGQIYIEPQGMCVMAGIGLHDGKARCSLDSVHERLIGDYGVELLTPCYTKYRKELGEITSYPPGYKENGSVFCHNNPWVSIAETMLHNGDNAFDIYKRTCPAYLEDRGEIRRTEPYVYAQTVAGRSSYSEGEAKNSWLTGTAAWAFVNISQYILGVQPTLNGLKICPCLPKELSELTIERVYRGARYRIKIKKTGIYSLKADGEVLSGDVIPYDPTKEAIDVEVTI